MKKELQASFLDDINAPIPTNAQKARPFWLYLSDVSEPSLKRSMFFTGYPHIVQDEEWKSKYLQPTYIWSVGMIWQLAT